MKKYNLILCLVILTLTSITYVSALTVNWSSPNLVSYWALNDSSSPIIDMLKIKNGTAGNISFGVVSSVTTGINFTTPANSYINLTDSHYRVAGNMTITACVYGSFIGRYSYIMSDWSTNQRNYMLYIDTVSAQLCSNSGAGNSSSRASDSCSNTTIANNTWTPVAYVRDTSTGKVSTYIRGVQVDSWNYNFSGSNATANGIGLGMVSGVGSYQGLMAEASFWTIPLNASQIAEMNCTTGFQGINPNTINLTIISPSGTLSSQSFNVNVSVNGSSPYCYFNITRGASTEVSNTEIPNCTGVSTSVSSDATYTINVFANDSHGNINVSSQSFIVSTGGGNNGGGGGGGGTTTIINVVNGWKMSFAGEISRLDAEMYSNSQRTFNVQFENTGSSSKTITLSCVDVEGSICTNVVFPDNPFSLALLKDTKQTISFDVKLPSTVANGNYKFNIVAKDDSGSEGLLTVFLGVGAKGIITGFVLKLFSSTTSGIPYILLFLPTLIFSLIISGKYIKKNPLKPLWVLGISFSLSILSLILF